MNKINSFQIFIDDDDADNKNKKNIINMNNSAEKIKSAVKNTKSAHKTAENIPSQNADKSAADNKLRSKHKNRRSKQSLRSVDSSNSTEPNKQYYNDRTNNRHIDKRNHNNYRHQTRNEIKQDKPKADIPFEFDLKEFLLYQEEITKKEIKEEQKYKPPNEWIHELIHSKHISQLYQPKINILK